VGGRQPLAARVVHVGVREAVRMRLGRGTGEEGGKGEVLVGGIAQVRPAEVIGAGVWVRGEEGPGFGGSVEQRRGGIDGGRGRRSGGDFVGMPGGGEDGRVGAFGGAGAGAGGPLSFGRRRSGVDFVFVGPAEWFLIAGTIGACGGGGQLEYDIELEYQSIPRFFYLELDRFDRPVWSRHI
jgi:hypothetical protein